MAGCFDPFRPRTSSFDLHTLMHRKRIASISKLFRSHSDSSVKHNGKGSDSPSQKKSPPASPPRPSSPDSSSSSKRSKKNHSTSPSSPSSAPTRRRFYRVVRDGDSKGEEYENPHVIRKFTKKYVAEHARFSQSRSLDEVNPKVLPYTIPDDAHTILKKPSFESPDLTPQHSPPVCHKRASFKEQVQIIEYDQKEKIKKRICYIHDDKLICEELTDDMQLLSVRRELIRRQGAARFHPEKKPLEVIKEPEADKPVKKPSEGLSDSESETSESQDVSLASVAFSDSEISYRCLESRGRNLSAESSDDADFDETLSDNSDDMTTINLRSGGEQHISDSPALERQLSSGSESSDSDQPSKVKKSRLETHPVGKVLEVES